MCTLTFRCACQPIYRLCLEVLARQDVALQRRLGGAGFVVTSVERDFDAVVGEEYVRVLARKD
jgi:hypothetical protein